MQVVLPLLAVCRVRPVSLVWGGGSGGGATQQTTSRSIPHSSSSSSSSSSVLVRLLLPPRHHLTYLTMLGGITGAWPHHLLVLLRQWGHSKVRGRGQEQGQGCGQPLLKLPIWAHLPHLPHLSATAVMTCAT